MTTIETTIRGIPGLVEALQQRAEDNAVMAAKRASDLDWLLGEVRAKYPLWAEELERDLDRRKRE